MANQTKPLYKVRAGSVSAAVWPNSATVNGKPTTILKATVERRYRDSNGTWQSSESFARNEVALAIWCLQKSFDAMIENAAQQGDDASEESVM